MVLMRRKDKRRGNEEHELVVASDSSIVANKGVRSLAGARTGRFAADMRANVGGYGRPDKTWGIDHPWHTTQQDNLFEALCARDHMEEGELVKETEKPRDAKLGVSRAALKKKKAKLKKQGMTSQEATLAALKEAEEAKRLEEEKRVKEEEERQLKKEKRKREREQERREKLQEEEIAALGLNDESEMAVDKDTEDEEGQELGSESEDHDENKEPTHKRTQELSNTKKSKGKAKLAAAVKLESEDDQEGDDDADDVENKKVVQSNSKKKAGSDAKRVKEKNQKQDKQEANNNDNSVEGNDNQQDKRREIQLREQLAREYDAMVGTEITTKSGLIIRDLRVGHGKLAEIGEMLTVKYKGRLGKDGLVFGKGMLTPKYGTGSVIAGWEEGMGTMRPGGIRLLTIPPELGYGASSKGGKIPPNATLHFEVELVRIGKRKRETIGKDDIPLPSAFQRKRMKQTPKSGATDESTGAESKKKRKKRSSKRRRKNSEV